MKISHIYRWYDNIYKGLLFLKGETDNMERYFKKILDTINNKNLNIYTYFFIFIISFLIIVGQDYRLVEGNDDVVHTSLIEKFGSSWNFMIEQYKGWNSRYFTSLAMAYIMDKNIWLWRVLNTFVLFALIIYSSKIIKILYNLDIKKYTVVLLGMFASFSLLSTRIWTQSIIWVTGSFNYLWPASALVMSLYYLLNSPLNKEKIKLYQFIILLPVVMFASNTEQTALICITMYSIVILYFILKERYCDKYILILYLVAITSTLVVFLSPSIPLRYAQETKTWYPMFNDISIIGKAVYGYSYTVIHGFLLYNYPNTILLSVLLFIILKKQYNNKVHNILSLIPVFYSLIYYIGRVNTEWRDNLPVYNSIEFSKRYLNNNLNEPFISVIIGSLIIIIIIYFLFKIDWSSIERKYLALLFFAAALMSAFILSFSPTIYASGERIWFIPYTMYIIGIGILFTETLNYINIKSKKFMVIFALYFIVGIVDVFSKVYR